MNNKIVEQDELEICWNCGDNVFPGSGKFVNRIPSGDSIETRRENGAEHPEGAFLCAECEESFDEEEVV